MTPFTIHLAEETLLDLKHRLSHTRWPDEIINSDWDYGTNLSYLKDLADYWQNQFDWRVQEQKLNHFKHFITDIDGFKLHFIYEKGKSEKSLPLLLTHGWPSCFAEMVKMIPMLTQPDEAGYSFDVIVPSLPGFGFSDKPSTPGWNALKMSEIIFKLMTEVLGYKKFGVHGGDWGVSINACLAFHHPEAVVGLHAMTARGGTPAEPYPGTQPASTAELQYFARDNEWVEREGAYAHVQSTKPQTLGYALNDSPVGLAAEVVEKYRTWSDCKGEVETRFSKDDLLTFITLYWATQTINSSMRIYYESAKDPWRLGPSEKITVPCAIAGFKHDNVPPLREWAERFYNIQRWNEFDRGGHFPAFEEPELLAKDIRAFFTH